MRLDIEEDVKTLRERFNIDQKAIDYFCASSRLLKLGISKGLTLYDIACMCCRNDDLGELPSRLEALFSMAADLAELAIENGRWHHSTASKALTEQIALNSGSLLGTPRMASRMRKVASSVEFGGGLVGLQLMEKDLQLMDKDETLPGMVNSSASDSSSDIFDCEQVDQDETEQWAAEMVLDVSMDKSMSIAKTTRSSRSDSIESEGSSDSSNQGFWQYSPRDDSDNDDKSWSSCESLDDQPCNHRESPPTPDKRCNRLSLTPVINSNLPADNVSNLAIPTYRGASKVTFDPATIEFDPDPSDEFDTKPEQPLEVPDMPALKLQRSQSYSGLSSALQIPKARNDLTDTARSDYEEVYRKYFTSFVKTVIDQEATAAAKVASHK